MQRSGASMGNDPCQYQNQNRRQCPNEIPVIHFRRPNRLVGMQQQKPVDAKPEFCKAQQGAIANRHWGRLAILMRSEPSPAGIPVFIVDICSIHVFLRGDSIIVYAREYLWSKTPSPTRDPQADPPPPDRSVAFELPPSHVLSPHQTP